MTQERLSRRSEFTPIPSHSSTFVTWYHQRMSYRCESPRLLYRGENFTPVRNLATVSCNAKRQRNDHTFRCEFGLPVDWNGKLMRNVCDFESRVYFYQHEVYMKWLSHHVNAIRNQKVIPVLNSRRWEFSHINTPQYPFLGASSERPQIFELTTGGMVELVQNRKQKALGKEKKTKNKK